MKKNNSKIVYLVASGDLRLSANRACEAAQAAMEKTTSPKMDGPR